MMQRKRSEGRRNEFYKVGGLDCEAGGLIFGWVPAVGWPTRALKMRDNRSMSDQDINEPHAVSSPAPGFDELVAQLESRCKAASIKVEQLEGFERTKFVRIHFPSGRQTEQVAFFGIEGIQQLLSVPFEKYVFVGGYDALCCYEDGVIEAGIAPAGIVGPMSSVLRRIHGARPDQATRNQDLPPLEIPNPG